MAGQVDNKGYGAKWRLVSRIFVLLLAVVFGLQVLVRLQSFLVDTLAFDTAFEPYIKMLRISDLILALPALSPFLSICSMVALRSVGWLSLLGLPVLLISLKRGRWFCSHMCPTGLLAEYLGRLRPGVKNSLPKLGPFLLLAALGGAILGYPFFLWLDPLSMFNGFLSVWRKPFAVANALPGVGLILVLVLSFWRPGGWCYRLCPLGFLQEMLGNIVRRKKSTSPIKRPPMLISSRRAFLAATTGAVVGGVTCKFSGESTAIRPPGIVDESKMGSLCIRCGNCMRACPDKIIQPDMGATGIDRLLTPVLKMGDDGSCSAFCNECNKVCPTGAIAHISLDTKRTVRIGTAKVIKKNCLAWDKDEFCMVCDEYCGYNAIKMLENDHEQQCPEVDADICRGCGLCQSVCPAENVAIVVYGKPQKRLKPVEI